MKNVLVSRKTKLMTLVLALGVAVASFANAQSVTYPVTDGNANIGIAETYGVSAANTTSSASLALTSNSTVNLLGKTAPLIGLSQTSSVAAKPSANLAFKVGSYTVSSITTTTSTSYMVSSSQTLLSASANYNVTVGGVSVPVTVSGSLAGSGTANLNALLDVTNKKVTTTGSSGSSISGSATAAIPSTVKNTTVSTTSSFQFGTDTLTPNATVGFTSKSGGVTLSSTPLSLALSFTVASTTTKSNTATSNLGTYITPAYTVSLITLK